MNEFWIDFDELLSHSLSDGSSDSFSRISTLQFQIIMIFDMQSVEMRKEEKSVMKSSGKRWLLIFKIDIWKRTFENGNVSQSLSFQILHSMQYDGSDPSSSFINNFLAWYGSKNFWLARNRSECWCSYSLHSSSFSESMPFWQAFKKNWEISCICKSNDILKCRVSAQSAMRISLNKTQDKS